MAEIWDCVVVGAGVVGSWTAYHLTQQGYKTLLLEQFYLPHTRGSSHGQSRIIRMAYDSEVYGAMMPECYDWWKRLQEESGKTFYKKTGLLSVAPLTSSHQSKTQAAMDKTRLPYKLLSHQDLCHQYPMLNYPADHGALLDKEAGLLQPDKCLAALQGMIIRQGGTILDGQKVKAIQTGTAVTVTTTSGKYVSRNLVLTPGPWAKDVLSLVQLDVPIKAMPGRAFYWKVAWPEHYNAVTGCPILYHLQRHPTNRNAYRLHYVIPTYEYPGLIKTMPGRGVYLRIKSREHFGDEQNMPLVVNHLDLPDDQGYRFYAFFPTWEYSGLIKMVTRGEPPARYCHPDERDKDDKNEMVHMISEYIRKHLPGIEDKASIVEPCVYSMTPDRDFLIDRHPRYNNIVYGVGFSGHGFKVAPVVGKLLCEMATGSKLSYDVRPFRLDRFSTKSKL